LTHLANVMSVADVLAPVKARPLVPSAMVMSAPLAPAGTQGAGRLVTAATAEEAAADAEDAAEAVRDVAEAI
jgi:hypothetical protein